MRLSAWDPYLPQVYTIYVPLRVPRIPLNGWFRVHLGYMGGLFGMCTVTGPLQTGIAANILALAMLNIFVPI